MLLCRTINTGFGLDFRRLIAETAPELVEVWRILYDLEPWGDERTDLAIGTAIANNAGCHGVPPRAPRDYMEFLCKKPKPQTESDMKASVEAICRIASK